MKNQQSVRYALMCLRALGGDESISFNAHELSQREGLPFDACKSVLDRLCESGLLSCDSNGRYALRGPFEDLTALDVIRAMSPRRKMPPAFALLYGARRGAARPALHARAWSDAMGVALAG